MLTWPSTTTPYVLPELARGRDQDTVVAVPHEDGALDGRQEYLDVLAVVNSDGVAPVEQVNTTVGTVLDLELLTCH